jgi:predicted negative regulator of RcsB-dependent stress response
MAADTEEQQVDKIKNIWGIHKTKIISALIAFFVIYFSYQFYLSSQIKASEEASQIYQEILIEKTENDLIIEEKVNLLMDKYSNTPYAARSAIYFSKILVNKKDINLAAEKLIWAGNNSPENSLKSMAYFLLGNLYLIEQKYDDAMGAVNKIATDGYVGLANDLKGDIYSANGNKKSAHEAYQKALDFFKGQGEMFKVIENKKDALGK